MRLYISYVDLERTRSACNTFRRFAHIWKKIISPSPKRGWERFDSVWCNWCTKSSGCVMWAVRTNNPFRFGHTRYCFFQFGSGSISNNNWIDYILLSTQRFRWRAEPSASGKFLTSVSVRISNIVLNGVCVCAGEEEFFFITLGKIWHGLHTAWVCNIMTETMLW